MFTDGDLDTQVIKEPNPEWWGDAPQVDRIIMPFNTDEGTFVNAFNNREIDDTSGTRKVRLGNVR
jgi:peptide/nickel transport system substrate-binding protein